MDFPTRAQLFEILADEIIVRSQAREPSRRISPEEVFTDGSDVNILSASSSALGEEVIRQLARAYKALFLETAEREDLDRLVADRFASIVARKTATAALVPVIFRRAGGALAGLPIPVGTTVGTRTGVTFQTVTLASFPPGGLGPVSVVAQCSSAGLQGNVEPGTVTEIVSQLGDPAITVENVEPGAGGDDTEGDASLRERARDFFRVARRGIARAIEFGARTVPGVRLATAEEVLGPDGNPTGRVTLYIADANGQANSAFAAAVRVALFEWRAAGIFVDVRSAIPTFVEIVLRLRIASGFDSTLVFNAVRSAVVAGVNTLQPNQPLTRAQIFAAARSVPGAIVLDDAIVAPVGDVIPTAGEVLRTAAALVTAAP